MHFDLGARMAGATRFAAALVAATAGALGATASATAERAAPAEQDRSATSEVTVVVADAIVQPDGTLREGAAVVVRDGTIERVIDATEIPSGATVYRGGPGSVLSPGLIDVGSELGVAGDNVETSRPIQPEIRAIDAFDPADPSLEEALKQGVTSAVIVPAPRAVVPGRAATVRTRARDGRADAIESNGPIVVVLGSGALNTPTGPTARSGALFLLRRALDDSASSSSTSAGAGSLADALRGETGVMFLCETIEDVDHALRLADAYDLNASLMHTASALEASETLAGANTPVVLGPYGFGTERPTALGAAALSRRGVEVAFHGDLPARDASALRTTAAIAVSAGMSPAAARRALTSGAAKVAGVSDRIGSIAPGLDADLVVFTRDPLRPDATVEAVFVRGERVHDADWDTSESERR